MNELAKAFFNKSIEFSSEEEWRIVKKGEEGKEQIENAIVAVYLGANYRLLSDNNRE